MIEELLKYSETQAFLSDYPKGKWPICIEAVFIYGLLCIKRDFPSGLTIPELIKISGKLPSPTQSTIPTKPYSTSSPTKFLHTIPIPTSSQKPKTLIPSVSQPNLNNVQSSPLKDSTSQTSSKQTYLDMKPSKIFSSNISEPEIISIHNAAKLLKSESQDSIIPINLNPSSFQTRLQKRGLRKRVFPKLDIKLDLADSLNSTFSLSSIRP